MDHDAEQPTSLASIDMLQVPALPGLCLHTLFGAQIPSGSGQQQQQQQQKQQAPRPQQQREASPFLTHAAAEDKGTPKRQASVELPPSRQRDAEMAEMAERHLADVMSDESLESDKDMRYYTGFR